MSKFWWLVHNCVAHPLMGVYPSPTTFKFHDMTAPPAEPSLLDKVGQLEREVMELRNTLYLMGPNMAKKTKSKKASKRAQPQ